MIFDYDYTTMRDKYIEYLAYENDTDTYDVLIFTETPNSIGFIDKSDVICVFDHKSGAALAFIERVRKSDIPFRKRSTMFLHNRKVAREVPLGYECYIKMRGEYIEYQFYKRWWYDLSVQLGNIDLSEHIKPTGTSRKDKPSSSDI